MKKTLSLTLVSLMWSALALAEAPAGYFSKCEGKTGQALLTALYQTIGEPTTVGYDGLWTLYQTSDIDENGKIWDMYSTKRWNFSERCGNYSSVGDCYNREHSFPKSWFSDAQPMYSDAYHLYPTDGKVNGQRSNYPYGECASGTTLASNNGVKALGKLGKSTFSGYSGTVFEPVDEYKGDLARSYFYMVACYNGRVKNWNTDMLDGTSYPAFSSWAKSLLLKWSAQDPVSQKEINRNEIVAAAQHNRNPFIDHPELADYIWGDKVGQAWYSTTVSEPSFSLPAENSLIDFGYAAAGKTRSISVTVRGVNIASNVSVSVSGYGFSVSPSTLTAAAVNAGTAVTVSVNSSTAGTCEGTLRFTSGTLTRDVELTAEVVTGLPIMEPTDITSEGMTISWINVDDASTYYQLHVKQGTQYVSGYPKSVKASLEEYEILDLDPSTTYSIYLTSSTMTSRTVTATTADPIPYTELIYDGALDFSCDPGFASTDKEILVLVENIADPILVTVRSPFEISTDKAAWGQTVTLQPGDESFFIRCGATVAGEYTTSITLTAGTYVDDDVMATATVGTVEIFFETWEETDPGQTSLSTYTDKTFAGTACSWHTDNGGFWSADKSTTYNNTWMLRQGSNNNSMLEMAADKKGGLGTLSFEGRPYGSDADAVIDIYYSTDEGATWTKVDQITFAKNSSSTQKSVTINAPGSGRVRFLQTSGKRWVIDNIGITNYSSMSAVESSEYFSWSAWCRDNSLIVDCGETAANVAVNDLEGREWLKQSLTPGEHAFDLPQGLYIVAVNGHARRVLVK